MDYFDYILTLRQLFWSVPRVKAVDDSKAHLYWYRWAGATAAAADGAADDVADADGHCPPFGLCWAHRAHRPHRRRARTERVRASICHYHRWPSMCRSSCPHGACNRVWRWHHPVPHWTSICANPQWQRAARRMRERERKGNVCLISSWQKLDMQKHVLSLDGTLIGLKAVLSRISFLFFTTPPTRKPRICWKMSRAFASCVCANVCQFSCFPLSCSPLIRFLF